MEGNGDLLHQLRRGGRRAGGVKREVSVDWSTVDLLLEGEDVGGGGA